MKNANKKMPEKSIKPTGMTQAIDSGSTPRFNLKKRYDQLNNEQKAAVVNAYLAKFQVNLQGFYYAINKSQHLNDAQLLFFSGVFECRIHDLFTSPPQETPSVYELLRRAKGVKPGIQAGLDV